LLLLQFVKLNAHSFKTVANLGYVISEFTLVGKVFPVITAGKEDHYNSMTASGVVWGFFSRNPPLGVFFEQTVVRLK
jgi:hypothetical protein